MSLHTSTSTINAASDNGSTCWRLFCANAISFSNDHLSIRLQTTNLSTAINITIDRSVGDTDKRRVGHCFLALKGISLTLAGTEHTAGYRTATDSNMADTTTFGEVIGTIFRRGICAHITRLATAIDITHYRRSRATDIHSR